MHSHQAPLMVALMTLMNPLGTMVGFVIPFIFVNPDDSIDNMKNQFLYFMVTMAICSGVLLILTFVLFKGDKELKKLSMAHSKAEQAPGSVQFGTLVESDQ